MPSIIGVAFHRSSNNLTIHRRQGRPIAQFTTINAYVGKNDGNIVKEVEAGTYELIVATGKKAVSGSYALTITGIRTNSG